MDQFNDIPWKIIDMYFRDNPTGLIDHHLVSYNDFFNKGIKQVLKNQILFDLLKTSMNQAIQKIGFFNIKHIFILEEKMPTVFIMESL